MGWDNHGFIIHNRPSCPIPVLELSTDLAVEQDRTLIAILAGDKCVAKVKLREFVLGLMANLPNLAWLKLMKPVRRKDVKIDLDLIELIDSLSTLQRVGFLISLNETIVSRAVVQIMANLAEKDVAKVLRCLGQRNMNRFEEIVAAMPENRYRAMLMQADRGLLDQLTTIFDVEANA